MSMKNKAGCRAAQHQLRCLTFTSLVRVVVLALMLVTSIAPCHAHPHGGGGPPAGAGAAAPIHHQHPRHRNTNINGPPSHPGSSNGNRDYYDYQQQQQQQAPPRRLQQSTGSQVTNSDESVAARLRTALLANYDKNSFPWEQHWADSTADTTTNEEADDGLRSGVPVEVGINFHKVHKVNVAASTADLIVWMRLAWVDPRLAWNPEEHGNQTSMWFWTEDGMGGNEASEIWTPDIYLWNQEVPIQSTLDNTYAIVSSSGSVFWSRPGRMKSTCKFKGLGNFPFDDLKCTMELGSWAYSGLYIRPTKFDGTGYSIGGSETAGQAFSEFALTHVDCIESSYPPFPSAPEEDWPVLLYEVTFERASEPYVRGFVLLQILLNLCGFCCFWIRPHVGERMGLSITSLLAAVASELTVAAKLPASSEVNWFNIFSMVSMFFSVFVVFQSTMVTYFFYYTGDDLQPTYVKWMKKKWQAKSVPGQEADAEADRSGDVDEQPPTTTELGSRPCRKTVSNTFEPTDIAFEPSVEPDGDRRVSFSQDKFMDILLKSSRNVVQQHDVGDFRDANSRTNNMYWQGVANGIDEYSRLFFPTSYFLFIAIIFGNKGG